MATSKSKIELLHWAVRSRAANQTCALRLLALFEQHEKKWKTKRFSRAAQDLLSVSFSLWRAAFLADKTSKRADVFDHGKSFLEKIIEDNAISYPQDKNSREWTFNYYTRNARYSLQNLAAFWAGTAPPYCGKKRTPMKRWDYCQSLLDEAVTNSSPPLGGEVGRSTGQHQGKGCEAPGEGSTPHGRAGRRSLALRSHPALSVSSLIAGRVRYFTGGLRGRRLASEHRFDFTRERKST